MKITRFHRCEICERIYPCDRCFANTSSQSATLWQAKRGGHGHDNCDYRCPNCKKEKPE